MSKLICALVGLGRIGSSLEKDPLREKPCTHAGGLMKNSDCILTAACDIKAEAREAFAAQWSPEYSIELFEDIDALLKKVRPDILSIATPPDTHLKLVRKAAQARVPVVICEKPLAPSLKEARAIEKIHKEQQVKILVNHERRYSRDYQIAREYIRSKEYGELLSVRGTLYFGRNTPHRDVLLHDGTHMIDVINFLTGSTCNLKKRYGSMGLATSSVFLSGKAGPAALILEVGSRRDHLVFEIDMSFEFGRIRVGNGVFTFERSGASPYYSDYRSLLPEETPDIQQTGYFSGMIADAVKCRLEPHYTPVSGAGDSLEVMRFIRSARRRL